MAYTLQAFVVATSAQHKLTGFYKNAVAIEIGQGLSLVPLSTALFNEINKHATSNPVGWLHSLTENMEAELLKHIDNIKLAYIEAEYFGGRGDQTVIIWEKNKRLYLSDAGKGEINNVLKSFGVIADKVSDEFDTLSLGRYKKTDRWLDDIK